MTCSGDDGGEDELGIANSDVEWAAYLACFAFAEAADDEELPPQPCEIVPGIFLGGLKEAENIKALECLGVTCVLCMAPGVCGKIHYPATMELLDIDAEDADDYDIFARDVPCALEFLESRLNDGHRVLVHCYAGMNRSATVCAAWLLRKERRYLKDVVRHLAHERGVILQNENFLTGLVAMARSEGLLESASVAAACC